MFGAGGLGLCERKPRALSPRLILLLLVHQNVFLAQWDGHHYLLQFQMELLKSRRSDSWGVFCQDGPALRQRRQIGTKFGHAGIVPPRPIDTTASLK